MIYSSKR